ncbi:MAG: response regulator [Candidatus Eremiobacteraeota bacterium]|nr:response regulator [Candidatus Eremiobacteraeota bacterium]
MTAKVLVIDDDPEIIQVVKLILGKAGHEVLGAGNGREGIKMAQAEKPDAILLDLDMPVMDGGEVAALLLQNRKTCRIPIIFITALAQASDLQQDRKIGGRYYIEKPFKPEVLLESLSDAISEGPADEGCGAK